MNVSAARRRTVLGVAPFAIATVAALLAAPAGRTTAGDDDLVFRASAATVSGSADLSDVVFLAAAPEPEPRGVADEEPDEAVAPDSAELAISHVVMVANADGSATLSATFTGGRESTALQGAVSYTHLTLPTKRIV